MSAPMRVPDPIREQLRRVLLEEIDVVEFLGHAQRQEIGGDPRSLRCIGMMPLRRPEDPETSELRQVEIDIQWLADAWEVLRIRGIEPAS
jgi:hypothetical protein